MCKTEVKDYFKKTGKSHKADTTHTIAFFINVLAIFWSYYGMMAASSFVWATIHGIVRAILIVQTTHAASHFSMSMNPDFNRWTYRLCLVLIGMWSPKSWDLQHVVAHHGMLCHQSPLSLMFRAHDVIVANNSIHQ